jgi:hypothetical protein
MINVVNNAWYKNIRLFQYTFVRGFFVMVPRGVPREITTWAWVLKGGSRTQNSTKDPKFGPRASGTSSKKYLRAKIAKPK